MPSIGFTEILVVLLIITLLFGGKKIPELMKGLGSGIKEFKQAANGTDEKKEESKS
ncbi:MAG: twin-arginine translocase TatA/TatE family subunit [Candidatus Kapabacteria bacterium]|nr:twin-arginine translocase TatA/TatE family subunit [Candidatus Kapabacteria bacterium]MBX7154162.1 twin-arginine translocase TatA/TatE family subunit [Bacteroidota bacterium]